MVVRQNGLVKYSFSRYMFRRIQPEHKPPVETLRRVAGAGCSERFPKVWDGSYYTVVYMWRSRCGIAGLSKRAYEFARLYVIHLRTVDCIQMKILMDSLFGSEYEHTVTGLARHVLGVDDKPSRL